MQIISWNCRGLGNPLKVEAIKDLLKIVSSGILLLQETKIEEESLLLLSKTKWKLNVGKVVSARGTSGGLATLWSGEELQLNHWLATQHWIFTDLYHISSKISLALFNLYVPVNFNEKKECWKTLSDFIETNSPTNTIVAGDHNIYLAPNEKKDGVCGNDHFQDMVEELIQVCDLKEFKPKKER